MNSNHRFCFQFKNEKQRGARHSMMKSIWVFICEVCLIWCYLCLCFSKDSGRAKAAICCSIQRVFLDKPSKVYQLVEEKSRFFCWISTNCKGCSFKSFNYQEQNWFLKKHTWKTILIVNCKLLWQWWTYFRYVNNQKMFVLCELLLVCCK